MFGRENPILEPRRRLVSDGATLAVRTVEQVAPTNPAGLPLVPAASAYSIGVAERHIVDSLYATAESLAFAAEDPDCDALLDLGSVELLRAGAALDLLARRRARLDGR